MQGRRTFVVLDHWLSRWVSSPLLRTLLLVLAILVANVIAIAAASGVVTLATWLLSEGAR